MRIIVVAACAAALACGASTSRHDGQPPSADGSAITVRGSDMSGNLLDGLRTRLPNMTVTTRDTPCPLIFFRGQRSLRNAGNVSVYVDRTHMADTCILQQIGTSDVERVEIYPSGNVSLPGIQRNANGVIMVYRVRQ